MKSIVENFDLFAPKLVDKENITVQDIAPARVAVKH